MNNVTIYWNDICGNKTQKWAFWNPELSWLTDTPDLTYCFQLTLLEWIPIAFLIITIPLEIFDLRKRPIRSTGLYFKDKSPLYLIKQTFILFWIVAGILNMVSTVTEVEYLNGVQPSFLLIFNAALLVIFGLILFLVQLQQFKRSCVTSGILFNFWFLELVFMVVRLRSFILWQMSGEHITNLEWSVIGIRFLATIVLFVAHCFADNYQTDRHRDVNNSDHDVNQFSHDICPEEKASFLSRLTFLWFTGPTIKGFRKPYTFNDLWQLKHEYTSAYLLQKAVKMWDRLFARKKIRYAKRVGQTIIERNLALERGFKSNKELDEQSPSLLLTLGGVFWKGLIISVIFRLATDALAFAQPMLISELIQFIASDGSNSTNEVQQPVSYEWRGYLWAVLLPIVGMIRTIVFQQQFHYSYTIGMNLRTVTSGMIYRKALRLSSVARQAYTVGEVVNLMSIDAQRLEEGMTFLNMTLSAPVLIIISLVMIWNELGWAVLAGFGLAVLLIPINAYIANKTKSLQSKLMKIKDERIKLLDQTISGIKVLKMYAWEPAFQAKLTELRNNEVRHIRLMAYLRSAISVTAFCAPLLIALATFGAYVLSSPDHVLDAKKAFVSLALFNVMSFPLSMLPNLLAIMVQTNISLRRIRRYLMQPELQSPSCIPALPSTSYNSNSSTECLKEDVSSKSDNVIVIKNGTFGWNTETVLFRNLNFSAQQGKLYVIVGPVGVGKSSLIMAILNEMYRFEGFTQVKGSVAYVSQQAWCLNATVRDNILFGSPMNRSLYENVLKCCCLRPDLEQFPDGDLTEIGERGINLSGGQKQRISLARAVYQQADIYLLDDPLSAVDAYVANSLYNNIIGPSGLLRSRTRILVTHRLIKLDQADQILTVCRTNGKILPNVTSENEDESNQGEKNLAFEEEQQSPSTESNNDANGESYIGEMGTLSQLMESNGPFSAFVRTYMSEEQKDEPSKERTMSESAQSKLSDEGSVCLDDLCEQDLQDSQSLVRSGDFAAGRNSITSLKVAARLTEEEKMETGTINLGVLKAYQQAYGLIPLLTTLLSYALFVLSVVASNLWLSYWSDSGKKMSSTQNDASTRDYFLGVYGAIGAAQSIFTMANVLALAYGSSKASQSLHLSLLKNVLRAPSTFFDTTPSGRILNRFSRDIDTVDLTIPMNMRILLITLADVLSAFVLISITMPWFLLALVPITLMFIGIQRLYIRIGRQLKRIDSVQRSPIYSHFQESLAGTACIRAYRRVDEFLAKSDLLMDKSQMARYPNIVCFRWLGVVVEFLGHMITLIVCLIAVSSRNTIGPGFAGLAITFTLKIANALTFVIRTGSDLETAFVSVERIKEYSDVPSEAPWRIPNSTLPEINWPMSGEIVFDRYSTRYRPELDLVLRSISAKIQPGERIGIVGRTGAGKSSLTMALFRLIEPVDGKILIDNVQTDQIGLHDLREALTIIPQEPILFAGTLRFNLDPSGVQTDADLWEALENAHLKEFIENQPDQLDFVCAEGGENMSVGQRQLVCLARALLGRKKILVLDEATAAVDMQTDELIQETIRTKFAGHTVLTIAHRLATVLNYDKILVLKNGCVEEFDSPTKLLADKHSQFYQMVKESKLI